MIREQIKKDLKKAIEKSGVLEDNFLDNIEWFWRNVTTQNFATVEIDLPIGRLGREVSQVLGVAERKVWLRGLTFAKIRGWREGFEGHPEIDERYFRSIPRVLAYPDHVIEDVGEAGRYLLVGHLEKNFSVVVEVDLEGQRNWLVTAFMLRERYLFNKEVACLMHKKIGYPAGTAVSPILASPWRKASESGGSRFSTLQDTRADYNRLEKESQGSFRMHYTGTLDARKIYLEHSDKPEHGDYSSNVAMTIKNSKRKAQSAKQSFLRIVFAGATTINSKISSKLKASNPRELAELIVKHFPKVDYLEKIEVAAPGFINFYLKDAWLQDQVGAILKAGGDYGVSSKFIRKRRFFESKMQNSKLKVQVEFISANPTGPLHVGNARGGFAGDVLANVLEKVGFKVQREYYINDKGVQVEKLAQSVKAYCDAKKQSLTLNNVDIPEGGYPGEYVKRIAQKIDEREQKRGKLKGLERIKSFALAEILKNIKKTILRMGIKFDQYFSEQSLYDSSTARAAIKLLKDKNLTYKKDGAVWIKTSEYGDDKDRVLIKANGETTYIVSDIAYHWEKFEKRKFDKVILFWGADHHGYMPRFLAMIEALGYRGQAEIELIQLLRLARGSKVVRMSKRTGEYVTVDEVLDEIGLSAARFHFLAVPLSTPMTLDLEKAKEQSEKNPVYYVQYAHARMHGILAKAQSSKFKVQSLVQSSKLKHPQELALIRKLIQFPEVIIDIAENHEVHRLPQYAIEVADAFHRFYENCQVLSEDSELTAARLGLVEATRRVLAEVFGLMGISAPTEM